MPMNESVIESVTSTNFKVVAEAPAFYTQLAFGNAVSAQQNMNSLSQTLVGALAKQVIELDPAEAASIGRAVTDDEIALKIAGLLGSLSFSQMGAKVAQTTPPVTTGK
jgi:hypothetical protein